MLEALGTEEQIEKYLLPLTRNGRLASGTASEPNRRQQNVFAAKARKVEGGYVLAGVKNYATNQTMADVSVFSSGDDRSAAISGTRENA